MKFPPTFNPYGVIAERTPFELRPFDFVFEDGVEIFSIIVPEVREPTVARIAAGTPYGIDLLATPRIAAENPTSLLLFNVLKWLRRECDFSRASFGMRVREDSRIEIRLKFGPPWWWQYAQSVQGSVEKGQLSSPLRNEQGEAVGLSPRSGEVDGNQVSPNPIRPGATGTIPEAPSMARDAEPVRQPVSEGI